MSLQTIKDTFLKYWFALSALAIAIMYFLIDRKGRQISQLKMDAQKQVLGMELKRIRTEADKNEVERKQAMEDYIALKRRHHGLLTKLGLLQGEDKPGAGGDRGSS